MKTTIIKAKKIHTADILRLIDELAAFEKLTPPDKAAKKRLIRDAFKKNPSFEIFLAKAGSEIIGYIFYFFTYSTFLAKPTLYLEDIYISEVHRNKGIGGKLFNKLIETAKRKKCGRIEWCVLDWNRNAIKFYDKLPDTRPLKEWIFYRMSL